MALIDLCRFTLSFCPSAVRPYLYVFFFRSSILLCERDSKSIVTICFMDRPLVGFSRDPAPKRGSQIVITSIPITDRLTTTKCVIDLHLFESSNFAVSASKFSMSLDAEKYLKTDIFPNSFTPSHTP